MAENIKSSEKGKSLLNPIFIGVCFANLMYYFGQSSVNTMMTPYIKNMGVPTALIGTISSLFALTALFVKLFCGPATVSFYKKTLCLGASLTVCGAFTLFAFSTNVPMVVLARILQGMGVGFIAPVMLAIASDSLPSDKIVTGVGYFSIIQVLAQAFSPTIALKIRDSSFGYHGVFAAAAISLGIASVIILLLKIPDTRTEKIPFRLNFGTIFAVECIIPVILLVFTLMIHQSCEQWVLVYSEEIAGIPSIALYYTVNAIVLFISRPLCSTLAEKLGARNMLIPAFLLIAAAQFAIGHSTTLIMLVIAGAVYSMGLGCTQPVLQALCIKAVPENMRGVASSSSYIGIDGGSFVGPILAGVIASQFTAKGVYTATSIYALIAAFLVIIFYKKIKAIDEAK